MNIILVGEHDKGYGEPFSVKTISGRRLRKMISEIGLVCDLNNVFLWENGKKEIRDLKLILSNKKVIALGIVAQKECKRQGIESTYLPHPASRCRTLQNKLRQGLIDIENH